MSNLSLKDTLESASLIASRTVILFFTASITFGLSLRATSKRVNIDRTASAFPPVSIAVAISCANSSFSKESNPRGSNPLLPILLHLISLFGTPLLSTDQPRAGKEEIPTIAFVSPDAPATARAPPVAMAMDGFKRSTPRPITPAKAVPVAILGIGPTGADKEKDGIILSRSLNPSFALRVPISLRIFPSLLFGRASSRSTAIGVSNIPFREEDTTEPR